MAVELTITGPARNLTRCRAQRAAMARVHAGATDTVQIVFWLLDDSRKLSIELDQEAWLEMRDRVSRAFVFDDLPGQRTFV